jgi:hypothetical protein
MEQRQMSKFCIDLEGVMLPDAIAAVVEAWYDAQNEAGERPATKKCYTVEQLQKLLNRSKASVYRMLNTGNPKALDSLFDPCKLNPEYRCDIKDPISVSSDEVERWLTQKTNNKKLMPANAI